MVFDNKSRGFFGLRCLHTGKEVALKSIDVTATVGHVIAHVQSVLLYQNETAEAVETVFKFPLDDGSAVYKMEAEIDGRIITAECQEKEQAQKTYDDAKARGMTAFLLQEDQNSSDIFTCHLGNLPPQKEVKMTIAYVVELEIEMNQSVKFLLPMILNPRYHYQQRHQTRLSTYFFGIPQADQTVESGKGGYSFSLTINIQSQFSISHIETECSDLSVELQEPDRNTAKVSYSTDDCKLNSDILLYISYNNSNQPMAIIERGSSGQDGVMKKDMLLLNFCPEIREAKRRNGEYIFVIDRSGSMAGSNIKNASQTLMLLVKSLRPGCYFNIISFGSNFSFLFEKSVVYNREHSLTAIDHINKMEANMGGTELLRPLTVAFQVPLVPDNPRQVFVLTDGAISNVNETLEQVKKNSKTARLFSVGIGQGSSTALVKGLARAGHGRYEFVYGEDRLQQKVMSLMKFSLQPEIKNLSLEWTMSPGVTAVSIPNKMPTVFVGELVTLYAIISGAERNEIVCGTVILKGDIDGQPFEYELEFEGRGQSDDSTTASPIHRLAVKALIKDLEIEDMIKNEEEKKGEIILASLAGNVISKYTSFVGIDKESKVPIKQKVEDSSNVYADSLQMFGASAPVFGSAPLAMSPFSFGGGPSQQQSTGAALFGSRPSTFGASNQPVGQFYGSKQSASSSGFSSGGLFGSAGSGPPPPNAFCSFGSYQPQVAFGSSQSKGFGSPQQYSGFGSVQSKGFGSPQQYSGFGSVQSKGFGSPQQYSGFGSVQSKGFGSPQQSSGFGSNQSKGFGSPQQYSGFGSVQSKGFGSPQQSSGFGSGQSTGFGSSQQYSGFGLGQSTGFGSPQQSSAFGSSQQSSAFGSPQQSSAFGSPQQYSVFGSGQSAGFGSPQRTGGFGSGSTTTDDPLISVISLQDFDGSWSKSEQLIQLLKVPEDDTNPPQGIDSLSWITCLVLVWIEQNFIGRKDEWELIYNKASDWLNSVLKATSLEDLKAVAISKLNTL